MDIKQNTQSTTQVSGEGLEELSDEPVSDEPVVGEGLEELSDEPLESIAGGATITTTNGVVTSPIPRPRPQ